MTKPANVNTRETDKFSALAATWWDPGGPMRTLHAVNPLRTGFIAEQCELRGRTVIDIGCGGGVLAESLTRLERTSPASTWRRTCWASPARTHRRRA